MSTAAEELAQLETAITAVESGAQEYQVGSRRVRRADLGALYAERRRLKAEAYAESGYRTTVAVFDGR